MADGGSKPRKTSASGKKRASSENGPLKFEITSNFQLGREVQDAILADVSKRGFNSQSIFAIKLALEEAMINAIKHGNKLNPDKKVKVEAKVTQQAAEITVEDQGPGFNRKSVPDPTSDENIEKATGRGILLMEAYMTSVTWTNGGRRVKMVKRNEPDTLPRA